MQSLHIHIVHKSLIIVLETVCLKQYDALF